MNGLLRVAGQLFSGSLLGKLTGIVREILLASLFGTSGIVAAVRAAQAATFIPVNFFTSDVLSAGFLPLYSRYSTQDTARADTLFWFVATLLFVVSVLIVGLLSFGAHYWVAILVPGFNATEQALTIEFIDIFGFGVPFYIAGGLFSYREMGLGSYVLVSARATLQSVGMILGTLAAYWFHSPVLLAWGFSGAYLIYSIWGFLRAMRHGLVARSLRLSRIEISATIFEFWRVVKPLLFLPLFLQGNIAAERAVASLLGIHVAASLDYAKFITDTGVLLLAVPLGLASLSVISRLSEPECRDLVAGFLPILLLVTVPISVGLSVHSHIVIATIYQRGAFGAESTELTQSILVGFAAGFWAQVLGYVLLKTLSARLRNAEVFRFMALALGANFAINLGLYHWVGPSVLGFGNFAYALVLLVCASRALRVGKVISSRLMRLSACAVGYALLAQLLPPKGLLAIIAAIFLFIVYWISCTAAIPLLRGDAIDAFRRMRKPAI